MNYYIITFTKSHHQITEEQKKTITSSDLQRIEVDGCIIKANNIAEILSEEKYYNQYPDKRPSEIKTDFEDIYGLTGNQQIRQPSEKAAELMRKGFLDYFVEEKAVSEEQAKIKWNKFRLGEAF